MKENASDKASDQKDSQIPLFIEEEGVCGHWLDFPYSFHRLPVVLPHWQYLLWSDEQMRIPNGIPFKLED